MKIESTRTIFVAVFIGVTLMLVAIIATTEVIKKQIAEIEFKPNITITSPSITIEPLNRYWNETEQQRVERECRMLCIGFDSWIPVLTENACVCCYRTLDYEKYGTLECHYWLLE